MTMGVDAHTDKVTKKRREVQLFEHPTSNNYQPGLTHTSFMIFLTSKNMDMLSPHSIFTASGRSDCLKDFFYMKSNQLFNIPTPLSALLKKKKVKLLQRLCVSFLLRVLTVG